MQTTLRLARTRAALRQPTRCLATAAAHPAHVVNTTSSSSSSVIPLSNVEAQWEKLSSDEQIAVHQQLEELQKKDWKALTLDEKKAAYYVAFGPHGARANPNPPGTTLKVILGTGALVGVAGLMFIGTRLLAPPAPRSRTKEWEEASNVRALEQKMNPITGISSEGYSGKGFVVSK